MKRLAWCLGVLALFTAPLAAQDDSRLVAAVRLAQDGQGDSARALINTLLSQTAPADTLYPQVLYTAGLVARNPGDRTGFFRRVAIEFASSSWGDDALLSLAQDEFGNGHADVAARTIEKLKADYPSTPLIAAASYWAVRAYFDLGKTAEACRWLDQGLTMVGDDVELRNQLNFYTPRCQAAIAAGPDTSRRDTATTAPPASGGRFAVQVAAVGSESGARSIVDQLRTAGYTPRLVRESGLVKVRVGHYADRAQAAAAAAEIRTKLSGSPFVVEEP